MKIEVLLARQGVMVPYRTLHRFAAEQCGFRAARRRRCGSSTASPGVECQIDFAQMGLLADPETGPAAEGARVDLHRGAIRGTCSCG